jgi:hypothetical protein
MARRSRVGVAPSAGMCAFFRCAFFCLCVHADALPKRCVVEVVTTCLKSRSLSSDFRERNQGLKSDSDFKFWPEIMCPLISR